MSGQTCLSCVCVYVYMFSSHTQIKLFIIPGVSHNCFYYTSKPECAIPDDNYYTRR